VITQEKVSINQILADMEEGSKCVKQGYALKNSARTALISAYALKFQWMWEFAPRHRIMFEYLTGLKTFLEFKKEEFDMMSPELVTEYVKEAVEYFKNNTDPDSQVIPKTINITEVGW